MGTSLILDINPSDESSVNGGSPSPGVKVSIIKDATVFNNNLTNGVTASQPKWETDHLLFSFGSEFLESNSTDFNLESGSFTLELWANLSVSGNHDIISKWRSSDGQQSYLAATNVSSQFTFTIKDTIGGFKSVNSGLAFATGNYYFIAAVWDLPAQLMKISATIEGVGSAQTFVTLSNTNGVSASIAPFRMGFDNFAGIRGKHGRLKVYNEARSQSQVNTDYLIGH